MSCGPDRRIAIILGFILLAGCGRGAGPVGDGPGPGEGAAGVDGPKDAADGRSRWERYEDSLRAAKSLAEFRDLLPTARWRRRMAEGDHEFTDENIGASETVLRKFLDDVAAAGGDAGRQRGAFEKAVKAFDRLNVEMNGFIETGEREDLGEFFNRVADLVGLKYADGDVTWEWRKEW